MASFTKVIEFSGEGVYIRFLPLAKNLPGYSHRVVIQDQDHKFIVSDWLREGVSVTHKTAQFYYEKHSALLAKFVPSEYEIF